MSMTKSLGKRAFSDSLLGPATDRNELSREFIRLRRIYLWGSIDGHQTVTRNSQPVTRTP